VTERFVGPIPSGSIPAQPSWTTPYCLSWNAFDVPRIWDMVAREGNQAAWEQVNGFMFLADFLQDQYRIWRELRGRIAEAWQSPAASEFLKVLDQYGEDLLSDAACARQTSYAWNRTVEALGNARSRIEPIKQQWDELTGDHSSLSWNYKADQLNRQARQIMVETDKAVADARAYIARPNPFQEPGNPEHGIVIEGDESSALSTGLPFGPEAGGSRPHVPPVPGFEPLANIQTTPQLATAGSLSSIPRFVEPVPGTPVSLLPIPPGNLYAPFGGAYVLPGPGVGRGGYVVPMPQPPGTGAITGSRTLMPPTATGGGGGVAGGMMPVPMAGPPGGGASHGAIYRRPNIAWHVDKGVPPVIKVDPDEFVLDQPSPKQEEEFRDWFTELAYPWRAEFKSSEGAQVTIRTVP
jgi:hypothetical protein